MTDTRNYSKKDRPYIAFTTGGPVPDPTDMGPNYKESPPTTEEIEEWREEMQRRQGNPVDTPLNQDDKGVDPVLGWPNRTRRT